MASSPEQLNEEAIPLEKCREGDAEAMRQLRELYHGLITGVLIKRGATPTEAEDIAADLWGDCVTQDERPSVLDKFSGRCTLRTWLVTVATNRLIDFNRRKKFRGELPQHRDEHAASDPFEQVAAPSVHDEEAGLVDLLKDSLQVAFAKCSGEALLMLRLIYLHGLTQREAGRMWGWHESKVSRHLSRAMSDIEEATLAEVRRRDQWVQLTWQDFVDLCQTHQVGFL